MVDAAGYRHWTDAELELLADRSLAAADVAAALAPRHLPDQVDGGRDRPAARLRRIAEADRGRDRPLAFGRVRETLRDGPAHPGGDARGRPRGGRRDGQPSGIGGNQASSLTPPGMRQCLMPPPCFTLLAGACSVA